MVSEEERKEEHLRNEIKCLTYVYLPSQQIKNKTEKRKKKKPEETMAAIFPNVVNLNIQDDL